MVGQPERTTQRRVAAFFQDALGYRHLGNWQGRADNANIETDLLRDWLNRRGHAAAVIDRALFQLEGAASVVRQWQRCTKPTYAVYDLLRYGVPARQPDVRHELRNRPADRLGQPGRQRLRHRRRGHDTG